MTTSRGSSVFLGLSMVKSSVLFLALAIPVTAVGDSPSASSTGLRPADRRLQEFRTLDGNSFPIQVVPDAEQWPSQREAIRTRILVAAGLHPLPVRSPLNAIVHGKIQRDDYTVERVIFESFPGHYVTGSLYRGASNSPGKRPVVLCPHGHWSAGRFQDHGVEAVRREIDAGAERFEIGGRHVIQARCVQLARMGCVAFAYDMEGYADSVQLGNHRPGVRPASDADRQGHLLFSPRAELHGHTLFGLQTWNSIRAVDFVSSLDDVDPGRIAVTGASGGGTQTMILSAVDDRIAAAMPAVMVSTAMQGGCPCENAPYLRIRQGNIDIAAATAPRPLGLICANDWTKNLETDGHPDLAALYELLGYPDRYEAHFRVEFPHNYNAVNRRAMYRFINRHFQLGFDEPIIERDFTPLDRDAEATVWTNEHPQPTGTQVGEPHERRLTNAWTAATTAALDELNDANRQRLFNRALQIMVGRQANETGRVGWEIANKIDQGQHLLMTGMLTATEHQEQLPALFLYPNADWNHEVVIWLTDRGKSGVLEEQRTPIPDVAALLKQGFAVASIDLLGQGEFVTETDNSAIDSVRLLPHGGGDNPWQQAACYTFGYNPSLFAQRVHDVLTLAHFVRQKDATHPDVSKIHLVALGRQVGPVGLAARTLLGDQVEHSAVDVRGFQFEQVNRLDHPMFLPGILRYGGIDALWALARRRGAVAVDSGEAALRALKKQR